MNSSSFSVHVVIIVQLSPSSLNTIKLGFIESNEIESILIFNPLFINFSFFSSFSFKIFLFIS